MIIHLLTAMTEIMKLNRIAVKKFAKSLMTSSPFQENVNIGHFRHLIK